MSTTENPTDPSVPGAAHATAAGDGAAASGEGSLSLAELNSYLGKDFKDVPTALASIKETHRFVGMKEEQIREKVRAELASGNPSDPSAPASKSDVQRLERDLFFSQNPQYAGHRALIEKLGTNPAEVVEMPEFKAVFEKVQEADSVASKKSVVSSSPRLAQAKTTTEEAVHVANARGTSATDVAEVLARGINQEALQG